jgi:hypothetical protein
MARLMKPADFDKMFTAALTDKKFQKDLRKRGFKVLEERGIAHQVPPNVQKTLEAALFAKPVGGAARKPKCGVCGVCGTCSLCGEVNFGAGSAALWALFALGLTAGTSPR